MGNIRQINIKNRTYYFFNGMLILKTLTQVDKKDKKSYKNIGIYHIRYITVKSISNCGNFNSVNPLYLIIGDVDGYIECSSTECNSIEENNGNKYVTFASTDKNKKVLRNMQSFGMKLNIISKQ